MVLSRRLPFRRQNRIVSVAGGGGGPVGTLPLDIYPNALCGFSLRRIKTGYTGPAIRVIDGENERDLFFTEDGELENWTPNSSLVTYVVRWYDQTGNGHHKTRGFSGANQSPQLASGSAKRLTVNGKPCVWVGNSDQAFLRHDEAVVQPSTAPGFTTSVVMQVQAGFNGVMHAVWGIGVNAIPSRYVLSCLGNRLAHGQFNGGSVFIGRQTQSGTLGFEANDAGNTVLASSFSTTYDGGVLSAGCGLYVNGVALPNLINYQSAGEYTKGPETTLKCTIASGENRSSIGGNSSFQEELIFHRELTVEEVTALGSEQAAYWRG